MNELEYLHKPPYKYWFDACKHIYHQDKLHDFLNEERIMPIHIDIGIHKSCDIKCIFCYGIYQGPSPHFIPTERLLMLAHDAKRAKIRSLAIIGDGEPTLNQGLYIFVETLKQLGIDTSCATHGLTLNESSIKTLTHSLTWLRFNVSATGDNYTKIHRGAGRLGGWEQIKRNIRLAVKYKNECDVGLQMVCIPQNFQDIVPLAEFAVDEGVDYLVIKQFSQPEEAIPVKFNVREEYEKAYPLLKDAERLSNDTTSIIVKWSAMKDSASITDTHKWPFDRCIDLPFIFQISGDGGCYPCGYLFGNTNYCYGNVCNTRLYDILHSKHYWDIIEKVKNTPLPFLCKGQCRHTESLKFLDKLTHTYTGDLEETLIKMCGGKEQYKLLINNPPRHINFL